MSDEATAARRHPAERRCPACGAADLQEGFLEDTGEFSKGFVRWIAGPLQMGRRGRAATAEATPRWLVDAHRCATCGHLALFAHRRI